MMAKVSDFGISKLLNSTISTMTTALTIQYTPPEILEIEVLDESEKETNFPTVTFEGQV